METIHFHNIMSKKQHIKTNLILNQHKTKLIKRYKKKYLLNIELNKTQQLLIKNENKIKKETFSLEHLYEMFLNYEYLNETCWDLTKLMPQYNEIIQQIDKIYY